ncbi:Uncharacterised protein [Streptococcus pneumoniae]|uniref:hypothetical protein n=1 Tax=Bacilli TaxID=91061 RepID=UPI0005DCD4A1|nr:MULTISPECIES: hypothetical protein [Bacilli]CKE75780.1 Uncharacterised protein [Streptococcus pneumoniae]CKE78400.1 Uncharacterised protein [Streptococcus pneumoniae]CKE87985.1 Uncharacterised protein [Streptococcus pneumoniae]CKF08506.1 Uncharacterised protein [Streptococcus pneumoniae]CKF17465.1 Uncharacterised protein [Streptococcus pneumoniae]
MGLKKPAVGGTPSASGVISGQTGYVLKLPKLSFVPNVIVVLEKDTSVKKNETQAISFIYFKGRKIANRDSWGDRNYNDYYAIGDTGISSSRYMTAKDGFEFSSGAEITGKQFEWYAYGE